MSKIVNLRRQKQYFQAVSEILSSEITNANIARTTVVDVILSTDGSFLKVFVVFEKSPQTSLEYLNKSKNYVRTMLAQSIQDGRITPKITFEIDKSSVNGLRIQEIIDSWKK